MKKKFNPDFRSQGRDKNHQERLYIVMDYAIILWLIFLTIYMGYLILV